jgi:acyl-CoA reductase-like NAD-dependent aldehyde dehydrogenase
MTTQLTCISPINGQTYATRNALSQDAAEQNVERAKRAQKEWANRSIDDRIQLVMAGIEQIGSEKDRMVEELAHQMGRPIRYGGEFSGFQERGAYMASIAKQSLAPLMIEDSDQFTRMIKREPQGIVLVVAPWNYPYMTAINTIAPALIAGNSVILKHSTQTLLVGEHLAEAFRKAGVPPEVFQNLLLDHETTSKLISNKAFNFINFTGSVGGGVAMETAAAGTFASVSTELGGKDPGYVMEDADVDQAVDSLIDGAMFNSGQCCCGIERIYVHESVYEEFLAKAVALVQSYTLGNPLDPNTTIGPMANIRFANETRAQIQEALDDGAIAHIDQFEEDDGVNCYVTPQILTNVTHQMRIMRDETFGPVVGIMKVTSDAEAVALMNDSEFGLSVSLWSADADRCERLGAQIETGTVFMNRCDYLDPALCWTGCKNTGRGAGLSVLGFQAVTRPKSYHLKKKVN